MAHGWYYTYSVASPRNLYNVIDWCIECHTATTVQLLLVEDSPYQNNAQCCAQKLLETLLNNTINNFKPLPKAFKSRKSGDADIFRGGSIYTQRPVYEQCKCTLDGTLASEKIYTESVLQTLYCILKVQGPAGP